MADEEGPIEAAPATPDSVVMPGMPQPSAFDKAVQKTNNLVGALQFQITLYQEQIEELQASDKMKDEKIKALEDALVPFLVTEPDAASAGEATGTVSSIKGKTRTAAKD